MAQSLIERINQTNAPVQPKAQKSYSSGSLLWGFDYGSSNRNRDLRMDEYGAAQAVAVVTEVQRAVKFWQQWLGGLTWHLYDGKTDEIIISSTDRKPPVGNGALWFNAMKRFSRNWKHGLLESIAFSDWVYAETFIAKHRNLVQVADFMWLNPLATEPMILQGEIAYYTYQSSDPDDPYRLNVRDVAYRIAQRNPYDDWRGISPVLTAINDVNIVENAKRALIGYYRKGMQLGGIVSGKPSSEGAWSVDGNTLDEIKDEMRHKHQGVQNFWDWFFSNAPVDVHPFEQVDISKNWSVIEPLRKQIAMAMGVPPVLSGDPTEVNYDNADKVMRNWWATDGIPYATQVADFVNDDLLPAVEPNTDMYFGFDFTQYETEDPATVSTDFTSQIIPINVAQKARGYEVDEDLADIYIVAGVPMHKSIIKQVAMQVPPQFQAQPAPAPMGEPTAPPATEAPLPVGAEETDVTPVTPIGDEPQKKYDPNQPRDSNGQFGSGGGGSSSGGGSDKPSGDSDKPKKPKNPKKPKPDDKPDKPKPSGEISNEKPAWAQGYDRNAAMDDGYLDMGHIEDNPVNGMGNLAEKQIASDHARNLSPRHQEATQTYTGEAYRDINNGLRKGEIPEDYADTVADIDEAMSQNALSQNTVLYRGFKMNDNLSEQIRPGATFTDMAYTSTSFDQTNANRFSGATGSAVMRIKAPAGTNGVAVSGFSEYPEEREFLLPRNTSYRITGVSRDSAGKLYIDAEIVANANRMKQIVAMLLKGRKQADNPPPSEDDRSDKFNWSEGDIIFDEPVEGEAEDDNSEDTDTPAPDGKSAFLTLSDPIADDLRLWQKVAIRRTKGNNGKPVTEFQSEHIPPILHAAIRGALQTVRTTDEIYTVFDDAVRYLAHDELAH